MEEVSMLFSSPLELIGSLMLIVSAIVWVSELSKIYIWAQIIEIIGSMGGLWLIVISHSVPGPGLHLFTYIVLFIVAIRLSQVVL